MWQVQPGSLSASWACRKRERVLFIKINKDFFLFLQDRTCKMLHKHGGGAGQLCHTREFQKQVQVREGCLPALMCSAFIAAFLPVAVFQKFIFFVVPGVCVTLPDKCYMPQPHVEVWMKPNFWQVFQLTRYVQALASRAFSLLVLF